MNKQDYMQVAEQAILHTYNRFPVVMDKGEGVYLYDTDGKKYLDFAAGIAVCGLGYGHPEYTKVIHEQVDKLMHTSNLFYNTAAGNAAEKLKKASGMDRVFFTNSGAEAIEGALKIAKKYAFEKDGTHDHEIIAMNHSFHGRTLGALSVTGNPHYQEAFLPLIDGVRFADYNDLESVKAQITSKTCAIILEGVQGEGGIYPPTEEFMKGIRALCDEHDMLMIVDEIQSGMGRTGYMFSYQKFGIEPDVMTVAKALGGGVPVGAFLCKEKAASLVAGDHGSTYGGNPLVCAAAEAVLDIFEKENIVAHVQQVGEYLYQKLEEVAAEFDVVTAHRGVGLMQGLEVSVAPSVVINKALEAGLVIISAGSNVLRFVPPLVITEVHVDEMIAVLKDCLAQV